MSRMAVMVRPAFSRFVVVVGLLAAIFCQTIAPAASSSANPPSSSGKRWVTFDLGNPDPTGEVPIGQSLELSMAVGGVSQSQTPLVAICESVLFERQLVLLEPDPDSMVMKGTASLDPIPHGKLSVIPKVARIQVTFARSQKDKLERVMTRIVYITLGQQQPVSDTKEPALPKNGELSGEGDGQDEVQPDVKPIPTGPVVEEDLLPLPTPGQGTAYWQGISALVSRSWSRAARRVRQSPSSETVRVKFKLYPSGRAQLIEIEKGSGAREIDEAGIYAVVHAQPFPPFPDEVGTEPVDVHVRMRTGAKAALQQATPEKNSRGSASNSGSATPNK